jgi:threonine/homoserine/homoserine lactone efflux protein
VDGNRVLAFAGVALLVILFPGPSVLFIVGRSLSLGRGLALVTVVGNQLGELVQACAVALGVGALLATSELAFTVVKLLGAAYLIVLGVQTLRRAGRSAAGASASAAGQPTLTVLRQGLIVGVSNPKTSVFFAAVLPQFVVPALGHVQVQMLVLAAVWAGIALITDSLWALAASRLREWLTTRPRRLTRMQQGSGAVMVALGVSLGVSSRTL